MLHITVKGYEDPEERFQKLLALHKAGHAIAVNADESMLLRIRLAIARNELAWSDVTVTADGEGWCITHEGDLVASQASVAKMFLGPIELIKKLREVQGI